MKTADGPPKRSGIPDPKLDEDHPMRTGTGGLAKQYTNEIERMQVDEIESASGSIQSGRDFRILRSLCLVMPRTSDAFVRLFL